VDNATEQELEFHKSSLPKPTFSAYIRNSYLAFAEDNWRFPANEAKYISLAPIFAC